MAKIVQIATAIQAVVGGVNQLTGQTTVTILKNTLALDENGHVWEYSPEALTPTWKKLPDLPDTITDLKDRKESPIRTN